MSKLLAPDGAVIFEGTYEECCLVLKGIKIGQMSQMEFEITKG